MNEIIIAGAGTGEFTQEVQDAIKNSDVIFSSPRFWKFLPAKKKIIDIKNFADFENEQGKILFLVSGDPGIFSLLPVIKKKCANVKVLAGISSLQKISAYAGETWHDAKIISGHGRELDAGKFLNVIERNKITILFCDKRISPRWACEKLSCLPDVKIFIGSNIGDDDEKFFTGKPEDFSRVKFPELSIVLIKNNNIYTPEKIFIRDKDFLREKNIVMTCESVRAVILSRLELNDCAIFWDIGAGSGSVSICAAHEFPYIDIHAVECNPNAVKLISQNAKKFHVHNIKIHEGRALEVIKNLPKPTHIFIGGTDGELPGILEYLSSLPAQSGLGVRVMIACVTLETISAAFALMRDKKNFEAVQISAASSKTLTQNFTMMNANNPVMIFSADF